MKDLCRRKKLCRLGTRSQRRSVDPAHGRRVGGTTGFGASRSLPVAPAKVSSLCFADLHHQDLRPGEPPEGQLNGGEGNEGGQGFGKVFEVLVETPVASEPGESALDNPAARQDDEALMSSLRLTISIRSGGTFATAASTCQAL